MGASSEQIVRFQTVLLNLTRCDLSRFGESVHRILAEDAKALQVGRVSVWFFDKGRSEIVCESLYSLKDHVYEKGMRLEARHYPDYFKALEESWTIAADDALTDPRTTEFSDSYLRPLGITSMLDVPIRRGGSVVGIVCHEHTGPKRVWTHEEQEFAASIADLVALTMETSERAQAEEATEKALSLLKATLDSTADGILVVDQSGKISSFNLKFVQMWRIPDSILASRDDDQALAYVLKQLREPERFLKKVRELYDKPTEESLDVLEFQDGRVFERYSCPQMIGEKIIGRVWSFRDITEKRKAEAVVKEERDKAQKYLDVAPIVFVVLDAKANTLLINKKGCELVGRREDQIIGRNWIDVFVPERIRPEIHELYRQTVTGEKAITPQYESPILTGNGEERMMSWSSTYLRDASGNIIGMLSAGEDVTYRKLAEAGLKARTEELARSNKELKQFASIVAHDIQEPLRTIGSFAERLVQMTAGRLNEKETDYLSRILRAVRRVGQFTQDLLVYSKVAAKEKIFERVRLDDVVAEVLQDLEHLIVESDIQIEVGPLPEVMADRTQMRQLFQNLLSNAVKFTQRIPKPRVTVDCLSSGNGSVEIIVKDNGIGFEPEFAERIFEPFERLHDREDYPGNGMGLAVCRKIVERHDGSITARGEVGEGATFRIVFPL